MERCKKALAKKKSHILQQFETTSERKAATGSLYSSLSSQHTAVLLDESLYEEIKQSNLAKHENEALCSVKALLML